jgi:thioredoxin reductase (NADPH)
LSAAIGAACEGLEVIMVADVLGGQAGGSSRIENFMGFPDGLSGPKLRDRACKQVRKFGGVIHEGRVARVEEGSRSPFVLHMENGEFMRARAVIVACGAHYNVPDWATNIKKGLHYVCTNETVRHAGHENVAVIGGGNSAGQATTYLASKCKHVDLIVRGPTLHTTMSHYLWMRIEKLPNVSIRTSTNIVSALTNNEGHLIGLVNDQNFVYDVSDVYVMIGSKPNCQFMGDLVDTDEKGFVLTDNLFQTKTPGIYAVGDIRSGNIKRVANACGEGAACTQVLFNFLNRS